MMPKKTGGLMDSLSRLSMMQDGEQPNEEPSEISTLDDFVNDLQDEPE